MALQQATKMTFISKRLFDLLISLVGLTFLLPVNLILCLLVWIKLGVPV
ncbi:MAG: sugar transferase, partial [Chloroflexi bacterium HGW-Chloroflexi-7]